MTEPLQQLFLRLPVALQNLGISLYGLAWRRERLGGRFARHVAAFRHREGWSPERMERYVDGELRRVLLHAFGQSPYYRTRWAEAGIGRHILAGLTVADLANLPVTPREHLRA